MLWCYQAKQGPWCYQFKNPSGETRLPHSLVLPRRGADKGLRAPASCTEVSGREVSTCKWKALGRLVSKSENASRLVQCYYPTESTASLSFTQTCRPMARLRLVSPKTQKICFLAQGSSLGSNGQVASGSCRNWERGLTVCGVPGPLLASLRVAAMAAAF